MGGDALAAEEDLEPGLGDAQVDCPAHQQVAHRVEVSPVGDMAVGLHLTAVDPLADLVGDPRQRPQQRPLDLLEALGPRALPLGERPGVVLAHLRGDSRPQGPHVREDLAPQGGDHVGGGAPHLVLGTGLVAGPADARRDDGGTVVRGHLLVGGVERDLALPRVRPDAGLQVVGHDHGRGAAEELEGVHVAAQPGILPHVERRLDVAVPAEGEARHEQVDLGHLAGHGVHERHRGPRPVDLHVSPGLVPHAADDVAPDGELAVALAEAVVGHRGLARGRGRLGVLGVQELERHARPRELPVHAVPVGVGVDGPRRGLIREQPPVDLGVRHSLGVVPCQARVLRRVEHLPDAVLGHVRRAGDRVLREPGRTEPEGLPGPDSSRHAVPPWSRLHDSRNVPAGGAEGNIGGAERQYSGCERTVPGRNIAGVKEGDYSKTAKSICERILTASFHAQTMQVYRLTTFK